MGASRPLVNQMIPYMINHYEKTSVILGLCCV